MSDLPLDDAGPTARALVALELIHDRPGVSGEHLAQRLGVSSRAARRYVGILRDAGIPVESTPGRYGGYRVGRGFRVPPLMFSTDQALALVMAAVRGRHAVGGAGAVEEALDKIIRVLPTALAEPAEALRQVGSAQLSDGPDPHLASVLARAAQDGRRVRLRYRTRPDSEARAMEVDPWGLNLRHDRWYLLCWSHTVDDRAVGAKRVLRIDRVERCDVLDATFERPADLDVVATVDEHMADGWGPTVVVLVEAPVDEVAHRLPRHLGRLEPVDERCCRLVGSMDDPEWFALQLIRLRAPFRVERPASLAEACRRIGERFVAAGTSSVGDPAHE